MKKNIAILALIFALFGIVSTDAFNEKEIRTQIPIQIPELEYNRQYPPGIEDMKGVEPRPSGFIKKGDKIQSNDDYLVDSVTVYSSAHGKSKYTYTYNENKQILTKTEYYWANDEWYVYSKVHYTYNEDGNLSAKLHKIGMNEENYERHTLTYNEDGRRRTYLWENWKNEEWVKIYRYIYSYDENGNLIIFLWEGWENEEWVNTGKYIYSYDENGNQITKLRKRWRNEEWVNVGRDTYSYDENGILITMLEEIRKNDEWVKWYRNTYSYDENGNQITKLSKRWRNEEWGNGSRTTYTYDVNGNLSTCKRESWYVVNNNGEWIEGDDILFFKDSNGNYYDFQAYKIEVKWTDITSVESNSDDSFSMTSFPNPFTNSTTIEYNLDNPSFVRIKLYNMLGIEVAGYGNGFMPGGRHTFVVNGSELADGVYILVLEADGERSSKVIHKVR